MLYLIIYSHPMKQSIGICDIIAYVIFIHLGDQKEFPFHLCKDIYV